MNSQRLSIIRKALKCLDLLFVSASFLAACMLGMDAELEYSLRGLFLVQIKIYSVVFFVYMLAIWTAVMSAFRLYDFSRFLDFHSAAANVVKATTSGTLVLFSVAALFEIQTMTFKFICTFWICVTALTLSARLLLGRILMSKRADGAYRHNVLVVGTNTHAINCVREIEKKAVFGYHFVGFVDDRTADSREHLKTGYETVAGFDELPEFLRTHVVDEVIICLPMKSCYQRAAQIVDQCEEQGVIVRHIADLFNHRVARSLQVQFDGESFITFFNGTLSEWRSFVKRSLDLVASSVLIVVLSPVFMLAALLIKLSSPGPVLFSQERLGVNKRRFKMHKFRTMVPDAEKRQAELEKFNEVDGPAFKIKDDPRITRIGKLLRKTSIDELPQLFNVLIGDMSLVGPRPLPVRDYEGFDKDWHRRRFSVRPGITCLWQISGRSNISFEKWMELDMQYIDSWSILLDIVILTKTIPAVIKGKGAE